MNQTSSLSEFSCPSGMPDFTLITSVELEGYVKKTQVRESDDFAQILSLPYHCLLPYLFLVTLRHFERTWVITLCQLSSIF